MAHIVIDARILGSTTGTYAEYLLRYLEKIDTTNTYTVLVPSKYFDQWVPVNTSFTRRACDIKNYSFAEQTTMKKLLTSLSPDLVHFLMPQQPIFHRGRTVTTFHDLSLLRVYNSDKNWLIYHVKQLIGQMVFRIVARKTNHIITPTDFVKHDVAKTLGVQEQKITRTYESVEPPSTALEPYDVPFERYLLYVGQQSDYKNVRALAAAHQQLLLAHPDLGLVLVGKLAGPIADNQAYFEAHGYKNIHFTGFLPNAQRDWLYKHTAAYVFPSLTEGFGLPGLEAMSYGAPVVSSNATCLPEVYGDAAHYFDPKNTADMARAIDDVLRDETLRRTLQQQAVKQLKKYSWATMGQQTHNIYETLLAD